VKLTGTLSFRYDGLRSVPVVLVIVIREMRPPPGPVPR
jgi:hypothetical protein